MTWTFLRGAILAAFLLGGCATEAPPEDPLPVPPAPPSRAQAARAVVPPARPRPSEAEVPPSAEAPPAAEAPGQAPPAAVPLPPPAAPPPAWRVARDGTQGCADPTPLRLLRQGADTPARLLAEARAAGGCRTTFRVNAWLFEAAEADLVRLRLQNGQALSLWFLRSDVVAP